MCWEITLFKLLHLPGTNELTPAHKNIMLDDNNEGLVQERHNSIADALVLP